MKAPGLVLLLAVGCGYGFAGRGPAVPVTARTVFIEAFTNRTRQYGLEVRLRRAIEDEFRRRGALAVAAERGDADLVLSGTIRSVQTLPVASGPTDEPIQYRSVMHVAFRLTERTSGRVIHDTPALAEEQDFAAVSNIVIPSSPHFRQGTVDLRDLADITDVQLGEAGRIGALGNLVDQVAHDVYVRAVEGF